MLVPKDREHIERFEKYGFKKCKKPYNHCWYLCVPRGVKMLFVSNLVFEIFDWKENDPRIHKNPNCKYRSQLDSLDIVYRLIKDGLLISDKEELK